MSSAKEKAIRKKKKKDGHFDGRFFEKTYDQPSLYLDEREHIQEQTEGEEGGGFEIEVSDHRTNCEG